jgi:hypothetical protein
MYLIWLSDRKVMEWKYQQSENFVCLIFPLKNSVFFINNMKGVAKLATSSCISMKNLSFMSPFAKNCNKFYELMPNYIDKRWGKDW